MAEKGAGMAAYAAPTQQGMSYSGLEFMNNVDGLFVQQKLELMEAFTGCEVKNRYNLTPIPLGMPDPMPKDWVQNFKTTAAQTPLLKAKEESECFQRICCPMFRAFDMDFKDGQGSTFFSFHRDFNCDPCYAPPLFMCVAQSILVKDAQGRVVSNSKERLNNCGQCCARTFETYDDNGNLIYLVRATECGTHTRGSNFCAPSCCNETYDVEVMDPATSQVIGASTYVWPGCNCAGLTEMTNVAIRFPPSSTEKQRAALMGTLFLVEYAVMEFRKQENNNNG